MRNLLVLTTLIVAWLIAGCSVSPSGQGSGKSEEGKFMNITVQKFMERQEKEALLLVDVRQPGELIGQLAALPGIVNIPLPELAKRYQEIPKDQPVVIICRSGNRSSQACHFLANQGYQQVLNLQGGMIAVKQHGSNN